MILLIYGFLKDEELGTSHVACIAEQVVYGHSSFLVQLTFFFTSVLVHLHKLLCWESLIVINVSMLRYLVSYQMKIFSENCYNKYEDILEFCLRFPVFLFSGKKYRNFGYWLTWIFCVILAAKIFVGVRSELRK